MFIHIAISPLKNPSRFEWLVEKATEIGIKEITPIITRYSEKKKVNHERLERITISSLKQSNQLFKPKINNTEKFYDFLKNNSDQKIMANLKTKNILIKESINSNQICLIIGPEGGFSDNEIQEAKKNKLDGVVCSPQEIKHIREIVGKNFIIVTPGIRLKSKIKSDDQKRVETPDKAIEMGANYLVIGRPITKSKNPLKTLKEINDTLL